MSTSIKTPGVTIQEVATLPASVVPVATAVPAFIGYTEKGSINEAVRIGSMVEYTEKFGGPNRRVLLEFTGDIETAGDVNPNGEFTLNFLGGKHHMFYQMRAYFENGGGDCYILSCGHYPTDVSTSATQVVKGNFDSCIATLKKIDEPTLIVMPDSTSLSDSSYGSVQQSALAQCANLQDRFCIIDLKSQSDQSDDLDDFRDNIGVENLKYGAAYYPNLLTGQKREIIVPEDDTHDAEITLQVTDGTTVRKTLAEALTDPTWNVSASRAAIWRAYIKLNGASVQPDLVLQPGSIMAGIYARVDRARGVWKAPANVGVRGVTGPQHKLNDADQAEYNVSTTGKSVNVIRQFSGKGTIVWGSRTLAGNDNEWRYVPVRRLYIMVEESIRKASASVVFEPNDANTWTKMRGMIENFLNILWRQGALAGAVPEHAYYVNVGLGETMTAQDILEGRLIVEVGMAAVRPAEFIILRFSHKLQEA